MKRVQNRRERYPRTGAAERQRRYRARRARGKRVYRVVVDEALIEDALRLHLHLSPTTDDPKEVERALNDMVAQFCDVARNADDR